MFAEVVLHRRVPSRFESFTYEVPKNFTVCAGQLVGVPFRKQKLSGIVRALHEKTPPYATRVLETCLPIILAPWQMELAAWMSEFYGCAFSKVIDLFVPEKVWKGGTGDQGSGISGRDESKRGNGLKMNSMVTKLVKKILTTPTKKLLLEKTKLPREKFYRSILREIPKGSQALLLFPELFSLQKFAGDLPLYHGELKELEKASIWHSVREGKIGVLAGTRAALFLPFKKLGVIVLDFEENENYLEKRQPHYHALEVAEKLSKIWKCPLIAMSPAPRVETWHRAISKDFEKYEWCEIQNPKFKIQNSTLIDMKDERRKGVTGIFAESVIEKIAARLSQNEQVLIFVNRKGEACALLCRDCHMIFRCRACSTPLTLHKEPGLPAGRQKLRCHRCQTSESLPTKCHACSSLRLKPIGAGTEGIEKEILKIFGKAKVLRLDRELLKREKIDEKNLAPADIIVATKIIDKPLDLPRLKLAVIPLADPLLSYPDFRAGERAFQLLTHLLLLTRGGELIIQTFLPEHPLFQNLQKNLIERFYEDELETRRSLSLPPFN